jgi:glycerol-3-phosphate dehydrogenase
MHRDLSALAAVEFDVVVVGGGVCGAAVAWDAAQRGLTVALVERGDFSGATSAESLKVVHGGIRYLQHLDVVRVRESCWERSALLRIAPHMVHPLPIVVPTYGHGMRGAEALGAAFALLSLLTIDRNRGIDDAARRIPAARLVSREQARSWFPQIDLGDATGAGVFWDGQFYNPSRLVWAFVQSAMRAGCVAANYCEVTSLLRRNGRAVGVGVEDRLSGGRFDLRARVVVNAAGPYAEALLTRVGVRRGGQTPFSRDMALVIRRNPGTDRGLALQTRYSDPDALLSRGSRHLFLMPWRDTTLIGVNSIVWREDPDRLRVTEAEVSGFLEEINEAVPSLRLGLQDVAMVMAGLLPLDSGETEDGNVSFGKRPLVTDNAKSDGVEGLITAISNRYTVARGVAERAVNLSFRKLDRAPSPCRTAFLPIHGGDISGFDALVSEVASALAAKGDRRAADRLARNYGSAYGDVLRLTRDDPGLATPIRGTEVMRAEVIHAVRTEMVHHLSDCVFRRTDLGTAGHPGDAALEECAGLVAGELGWGAEQREAEVEEVRRRFRIGDQ